MEFRLSENTVDSYNTYCTERNKYTGANGLDGGNWMVYKDWCEQENFICSWEDNSYTGQPNMPTKNGSSQLYQEVIDRIKPYLNIDKVVCLGVKDSAYGNGRYSGSGDGDGNCGVGWHSDETMRDAVFDNPRHKGMFWPYRLLLVRPL